MGRDRKWNSYVGGQRPSHSRSRSNGVIFRLSLLGGNTTVGRWKPFCSRQYIWNGRSGFLELGHKIANAVGSGEFLVEVAPLHKRMRFADESDTFTTGRNYARSLFRFGGNGIIMDNHYNPPIPASWNMRLAIDTSEIFDPCDVHLVFCVSSFYPESWSPPNTHGFREIPVFGQIICSIFQIVRLPLVHDSFLSLCDA